MLLAEQEQSIVICYDTYREKETNTKEKGLSFGEMSKRQAFSYDVCRLFFFAPNAKVSPKLLFGGRKAAAFFKNEKAS